MIVPRGYLTDTGSKSGGHAEPSLIDFTENRVRPLDECWSIHDKSEYLFRSITFIIPARREKDRMF